MKVAIYIRVSTEEQAREGYSIDAQKQRLSDFARSQAWEVYDYYIDDGYSAKDLDRPNVQRMMSDIKAQKFDVVLVYRLDRLVRSVVNLHELLTMFDRYGVKFKSSTEMFDTTSAMGRFFITLVGAMAQWERENIGERVKMGMTQKHAEGGRNGAMAPFGYDLTDGELVINPMEAEIIKRIFTLYLRNNGALAITKHFNREGVPRRTTDGTWNYNTIYYIITNPVYCGKIRWNYRKSHGNRTGEEVIVDGTHEAIISEETFEEARRMREERAVGGKVITSDYPFTGVLRCGRCGHAMVGGSRKTKNGRKRFYKCIGRFNYGQCDMPIISEDSVNEAYTDYLNESAANKMSRMVTVKDVSQNEDNAELRKQLERELDEVSRRKKKWHAAYIADAITEHDLREYTEDERKREAYLTAEIEKLPKQKESNMTTEDVIALLANLKTVWTQLTGETADYAKKQVINGAYESITINTDVTEAKGGPNRKVPVYIQSWSIKED